MRLWLFLAQTQGKSHYATGSSHKSKSLIDIISKPSFTTPKRDNIEINLGKAEPTLKPDATDLRLKSGHKKADQHVTIGEPPSIGPNTTKDSVTTAAALAAAKMAVRRTAYKSKQRKSLLEAIKELPYDKTMGLQMDQKEPLSTTVSNYPIQSPTLDILSRKKASKTASAIAKAIKTATDKTITRPQRSILPTEGLARQSVIPTLPTWNYNPPELLLTFLGTASSSSTIERNVSSSILRYTQGSISCSEPSGNHLNSLTSSPPSRLHMIFDCGDGTARQLGTCPIADIDRPKEPHWLFITHLHSDHFYGLPALVTRLESKHIHIFGPLGLFSFFGTLLSGISRGRITLHELIPPNTASLPQAFPYQHIPSNGGASQLPGMNLILKIHRPEKKGAGYIYDLADIQGEVKRESPTIMSARAGVEPLKMLIYKQQLKIQAAPIEHSAFCLGYIVTESHTAPEDDKKLTNSTDDDKKLTESSVVENVSLPTNETEDNIQAEFESSIEGDRATKDKLNVKVPIISSVPAMISRSVVILGDTCNASNLLEVLPCPPDVLVHEATFLESDASQAEATKHSTTIMAAEFIAKLCPKIVFLNHFGTRYFKNQGVQATLDVLRSQVIERIYKTNPQCKSEVILANDYLSFLVPSNNVVNETAVSGTPSENDPLSSILSVDTKKWEICDNFFLENQRRLARMKPKANNV